MRIKNHERLVVGRKRANLNQLQAARLAGLTYREYLRREQGPLTNSELKRLTVALQLPLEAPLRAGERCLLTRLRAGKTQAQVARELGCCRRWVMLMEKGLAPVDDLTWYWEQ